MSEILSALIMTPPSPLHQQNPDQRPVLNVSSIESNYILGPNKPVPELFSLTAEQALGCLHQSLENLIYLHQSLHRSSNALFPQINPSIRQSPPFVDDNDSSSGSSASSRSFEDLSPMSGLGRSPPAYTRSFQGGLLEAVGTDGESQSSQSQSQSYGPKGSLSARSNSGSGSFDPSVLLAEAAAVAAVVVEGQHRRPSESDETLEIGQQQHLHSQRKQSLAIGRRFWSKKTPEISTWKYLQRLHSFCPMSVSVYLGASLYLYRICVILQAIPLTPLNVHRLLLAALRVGCKSIEDINYVQKKFATVGGVSSIDLYRLEIALLFLIDFDIKVDHDVLQQHLTVLSELAVQAERYRASIAFKDLKFDSPLSPPVDA